MTSGVEKKSNFISISLLCYNVIIQWCEIMCVCHMWIFADKSWHGCEKSLTHFAKFHYVWHQIRRCGSFIILTYTWDVLNEAQKASFLTRYTWKCLGLGNARIHSIILKFLFEFLPGGYSNELKSILLFIMGTWEHLCCGQIWKSIVKNVKLFKKVCSESLCEGFMKYFTFFYWKTF